MAKKKKLDTINVIFCDRCGTLYGRIRVTETTIMPMCPVCHMEIFKYFIDEESKFIHFGDWNLFAEISEKLEAHSSQLGYQRRRSFDKSQVYPTYTDYVNLIRERTRKMSLMEQRFNPRAESNFAKSRAQKKKVVDGDE